MATLRDKMLDCLATAEVLGVPGYVGIVSGQGIMALKIDEVLEDGFVSDGGNYGWVPFLCVNEKLAAKIKAKKSSLVLPDEQKIIRPN